MRLGEFERAWGESDRVSGGPAALPSGRILIRCCRGLGDAIQFLRYAPGLKRHGDSVAVQGPLRLLPLLKHMRGIDRAIPLEEAIDAREYDSEIECSDLPYVFRTTLETIPREMPYIFLPQSRIELRRRELGPAGGRLKIGIAWAAGAWNPVRSIPPVYLEPLARIPGIALFSLKRGADVNDLWQSPLLAGIPHGERPEGNIDDTAATITGLDLVISVDTMVAHLAGALNRPVWVLLQHTADWRWMLRRSDTPWYPSMRLFRQPSPGDWAGAVQEVCEELSKFAGYARLPAASD
ncbi:MAG TPA: glycosyltransferase family 9 protein [Bryobacteraceae bacterium]|nr:glycosyltransferase family 9 protein [Bryobacteraceae bacterium]